MPRLRPRHRGGSAPRPRALLLVAAFLSAGLVATPLPRPALAQTRALPESFADIADKLLPAVVNISTTQLLPDRTQQRKALPDGQTVPPGSPFNDFFFDGHDGEAQGPRIHSLGSGFVVDPSGLIVTNNHVIAGAEEINVILSDDTTLKAQVVGRDTVTDLALLKVQPKQPLPQLNWGDSNKERVGDWVLAIGNPFGLGGSVTAGIVSARARDIQAGPYDDFLQTDAPINQGNSGGPLVNLAGEVIGINTAIYAPRGGAIGIGFAIPSAIARPIIEQLEKTGKVERGWLGIRIQQVTADIAQNLGLDKPRGALITDVDTNSPAAKAKLQPGDVVLSFDGKAIDRSRQLPRAIAETPPNKTVKLSYWRDGKEQSADVKVGVLNTDKLASAAPPAEALAKNTPTVKAAGMSLAKITPEVRKDLGLRDDVKGVAILGVDENGPAAKRGIQPGDLLAAVGRDPVAAPEQVVEKVEAARKAGRPSVLLRIERGGANQFFAVPITPAKAEPAKPPEKKPPESKPPEKPKAG